LWESVVSNEVRNRVRGSLLLANRRLRHEPLTPAFMPLAAAMPSPARGEGAVMRIAR
jgi:hypothetical protein